jgi:drug/metabolite transporter (DMT)-like permease
VGFGTWYVLLDVAARGGDPAWALVFSRAASAAIAAAVVAVRGFDRSSVPVAMVVIAGLFDVGGNALYVVSREHIPIGLAAALIGLYPIAARRRSGAARHRPHLDRRLSGAGRPCGSGLAVSRW